MRLFTVELTRLRWRRGVLVLLAGCVLLPAVLWFGLMWSTRPVTDAEVRQAKEQVADQEAMNREVVEDCVASPGDFEVDPEADDVEEACRLMINGDSDYRWYLSRQPLDVDAERENTGAGMMSAVGALVMLLGTTFAGHDWNSGSMSNQLLFEPRRLRVWAAKAAAVLLVGVAVSVVVFAAWWAAVWLVAGQRDVQATSAEWEAIRNTALRGAALTGLAGVVGYALTMFFRSTVATLGVMFGVAVVAQAVIAAVLGEGSVRWLIPTNVAAVLLNGVEYYDGGEQTCVGTGSGDLECSGMATLSLTHGVVYLGVLTAIVVALSLWSFRRRDVP